MSLTIYNLGYYINFQIKRLFFPELNISSETVINNFMKCTPKYKTKMKITNN